MKNVLLPTDFSENAFNAIEYAVQLFEEDECTFHLLNTFTPAAYSAEIFADNYATPVSQDVSKKHSEDGLLEIKAKLRMKFSNPKHTFKRLASFNLLVDEIEVVVKERNIDLIIMGTKGATGAKKVFLGTNTMATIKKINCPVIAVPKEFSYKKPKEVLFPTDFKFSMRNENLKTLRAICTSHEAQLNILNIYFGEPLSISQEKLKDRFDEFLKNTNHIFHTTEGVDLVEALEEFQRKRKANFLVMIQNKHSFFENLLFKPVIKEMVYKTNIPFMVIPSVELITP